MKVLFVTGAGISANAGIPTYRDNGSSWRDKELEKKSHYTRYGNHLDELWNKHWGPMGIQMNAAHFTYTHAAIADFEHHGHQTMIATQNIDTLHEQAGSHNVNHVHGTMQARCMRCKSTEVARFQVLMGAPACLNCGSRKTRPDVVLFGEPLNKRQFREIERFASSADRIVAVGTSLNVFPAAQLVYDHMAKAIIINKGGTRWDRWVQAAYDADCDTVIDNVLDGL